MSTVITTHHLGMASSTREEAGRLVSRVRDGMARISCKCFVDIASALYNTVTCGGLSCQGSFESFVYIVFMRFCVQFCF